MNETELKQEILATRVGGFGSSDAKMIATVGRTGILNETAKLRISQMLGIEPLDDFTSFYTENGKMREEQIFDFLTAGMVNIEIKALLIKYSYIIVNFYH